MPSKGASPRNADPEMTDQPSSLQEVSENDDILTKILLNLPIKSLHSFKSVSKRWRSLITDPHFITLRAPDPAAVSGLLYHHPSCCGFVWNKYTKNLNSSLNFVPLEGAKAPVDEFSFEPNTRIPNLSGIIILNSCNGLLLCLGYNETERVGGYHVLNPTTKQFETLPDPNLDDLRGLGLAYDPSRSPNYKVASLRAVETSTQLPGYKGYFEIEVYSSETGTWKSLGEKFTMYDGEPIRSSGVYWNRSITWLSIWTGSPYVNLDEERIGFMPELPDQKDDFWYNASGHADGPYLGESRGHLHLAGIFGQTTRFNVYEMKRDYSEWFVKYRVDLGATVTVSCYCPYSIVYIGRGEDGDGESFIVLYVPGKFVRYDLVDTSYKIIYECGSSTLPGDGSHLPSTFTYAESSSSVHRHRRCPDKGTQDWPGAYAQEAAT